MISEFTGESELFLRDIFNQAKVYSYKSPCVIFIDEIDSIAASRNINPENAAVVAQLLTLMDGMSSREEVVVIGATNRPNAIDPALRRPGR
jgi:transitional endoplasmic reticulum ATPase